MTREEELRLLQVQSDALDHASGYLQIFLQARKKMPKKKVRGTSLLFEILTDLIINLAEWSEEDDEAAIRLLLVATGLGVEALDSSKASEKMIEVAKTTYCWPMMAISGANNTEAAKNLLETFQVGTTPIDFTVGNNPRSLLWSSVFAGLFNRQEQLGLPAICREAIPRWGDAGADWVLENERTDVAANLLAQTSSPERGQLAKAFRRFLKLRVPDEPSSKTI